MTTPTGTQALAFEVLGPLTWTGEPDGSFIFASPLAKATGVYFWTVSTPHGELVYYIGETGRSFRERFFEHLQRYLSGMSGIYEPEDFARGCKKLIWNGMWRRGEERKAAEFLERYEELAPKIRQFVGMFRFWLLPMDCERRMRERIESAIAGHLNAQEGVIGGFQEDDIRYRPRRDDEAPIPVSFICAAKIRGLPESLVV